jgi:hypothetical protein
MLLRLAVIAAVSAAVVCALRLPEGATLAAPAGFPTGGIAVQCFYNNNNCTGGSVCHWAHLDTCVAISEYNVTDRFVDCVEPLDGSSGSFTQQTFDGVGSDVCPGKHFRAMSVPTGNCSQGVVALCVKHHEPPHFRHV